MWFKSYCSQAQSPEFKHQYCKKEIKNKKERKDMDSMHEGIKKK
jgi:hypothetical protein